MARKRVQRVVLRNKNKSLIKKRVFSTAFFLFVFSAVAIITAGSYFYLPGIIKQTQLLKVHEVVVRGIENDESLKIIKNHLAGWKEVSIIGLNKKRLINSLGEKFPQYKVKSCSYSLAGKLVLQMQPRMSMAYTLVSDVPYLIDQEGVIYPLDLGVSGVGFRSDELRSSKIDETLPEIVYFDDAGKQEIISFLTIWRDEHLALPLSIKKIVAKEFSEIELFIEDGTKITWGAVELDRAKIIDRCNRLNKVLEHALQKYGKLKYVNMRYLDDGRILVRPEEKLHKS